MAETRLNELLLGNTLSQRQLQRPPSGQAPTVGKSAKVRKFPTSPPLIALLYQQWWGN